MRTEHSTLYVMDYMSMFRPACMEKQLHHITFTMFILLLEFTSSYFIHLTSKNFTKYVSNIQAKPVFLLLYSYFCEHCKELKPTWEELKKKYLEDDRVLLGSLSCDSERSICNSFPHSGTPRIFWIPSGIESSEFYYNSYTLDEFSKFIEKRIDERVIKTIDCEMEYQSVLSRNENSSLFFLQNLNGDDETQKIIEELSKELDTTPSKFYNLLYKEVDVEEPILMFKSPFTNVTDILRDLSSKDDIRKFIRLHSFPPIYPATTFFLNEHIKKAMPFMLFYEENEPFFDELKKLIKVFPKELKIGIINCKETVGLCKTFGLYISDGTQFSIVNPSEKSYYHYEGNINPENISSWIERVMNGKEVALGPGGGLNGFIYNIKIQSKKPKFWYNLVRNLLIFIPLFGLFIFIVIKLYKLSQIPDEEIEKEEKIKND